MNVRRRSLLLLVVAALLLAAWLPRCSAETVELAYSFQDQDSGGAAVVRIDASSGQVLENQPLFDVAECRQPLKVRRTGDRKHLALTNLDENGPQLFLWSAGAPNEPRENRLPSLPDEVRIAGRLALVTLEEDAVAAVDIDRQQVVSLQALDQLLKPPANAPEDLTVDPREQLVVVSFQKDSKTGSKKGNRLVLFRLPKMEFVTDLRLPRERPDLHIDGNLKEQGPGPEVLDISLETDTLTVTLDLYGAVGMLRWSAAQAGRVEDWKMVSTGETSSINGLSFPDRATSLELFGRHYYLVCNAGKQGGSVLVDLQRRQVVWRRPTPPGLEAPVFVPELQQAFSVCSGKTKQRVGNDVAKSFAPQQELFMFDFRSPQAAREAPVQRVPLGGFTTQIALLSHQPPLLLIAIGSEPNQADELVVFDPVQGAIKDRQPALGTIGRFEQ